MKPSRIQLKANRMMVLLIKLSQMMREDLKKPEEGNSDRFLVLWSRNLADTAGSDSDQMYLNLLCLIVKYVMSLMATGLTSTRTSLSTDSVPLKRSQSDKQRKYSLITWNMIPNEDSSESCMFRALIWRRNALYVSI